MVFNITIEKLCIFLILCFYPGNKNIDDIAFNFCQHFCFAIKIIMLSRDYNCINTYWLIIVIIFQGNLTFCIRTQVRHFRIFFSANSS